MDDQPTRRIDADEPSPSRPVSKGRRSILGRALLILTLVYPAAWLTSRYVAVADLLSHFQEPALALTLFTSAYYALNHQKGVAIGLVLLAALQGFSVFRYLGPNPSTAAPGSEKRFRVLFCNVLLSNTNHQALIDLIATEKPDLIGLVEYTEEWQAALEPLKRDYPYSLQAPDGLGAAGLSLWFRQAPIAIDPPDPLTPGSWLAAHARFSFAGETRHIWLVHPMSPLAHGSGTNQSDLQAVGERVSRVEGSRIVIGDMNSTDGSAHFRSLLKRSTLRDSRYGFGRQPSWPVFSPYRIAIDHLFLSDDLAVVSRRLGPSVGSDHLPLIVDLAPASSSSNRASERPQTSISSVETSGSNLARP